MKFEKNLLKRIRGWIPSDPKLPKNNIHYALKPMVLALTATLLVVSIFLFYPHVALSGPPVIIKSTNSQSTALLTLPNQPAPSSSPLYVTDSEGSFSLSGSQGNLAYSMVRTIDGGLALAGVAYGTGVSNLWLLKAHPYNYAWTNVTYANILIGNASGSYPKEQWNTTYAGLHDCAANSVIQLANGDFVLAGYSNSSGSGGYDMLLAKTNADGILIWNMTYGGPKDDVALGLVQSNDEGFLIAGYTDSFGASPRSSWLLKTDSTGRLDWNVTCSGYGATSPIETSDGKCAFLTQYSNAFGLIKVDSFGNTLFNQTYGSSNVANEVTARSMIQTNDGGYAMVGQSSIDDNNSCLGWMIKTDQSGKTQWGYAYGTYGLNSIVQTSNGGYAIIGEGSRLMLTDSSGSIVWTETNAMVPSDNVNDFTKAYSLVEDGANRYFFLSLTNSSYSSDGQLALCRVILKAYVPPPS
jgi:hypothetical protein